MAYTSAWSPAIKITRAVLYTLLLLSSIGLIISSLRFGVVRGQPKYHPGEAITLAEGQGQGVFARKHHKTSIDLTSIVFPTQTTTHDHKFPSPTSSPSTSSTGGVVSSYSSHHKSSAKPTSSVAATSTSSSSHSSSTETGVSKTSWKASPTRHHGRPHPTSYTYCKTNKARLLYIAIAGLVSSTLVLSLLFIFPTAYSTFLSQFWFELVVVEVLFLAWAVVAFLATKEARILDECTRDHWRKPALLAFAWSGFAFNLLALAGLLAVAILEKSRGNDHIWKAKLNTYIFGERGIRLDDDAESRPILGH